ncbi:DUF4270 family protein [Cytophaga aurantiaca]|uniref:DUF4270 family protein n=1 Tax=Cytophaga aurantiaca TaxID=29530 RepID=UPI000370D218|nr:DUF4270 family protein [Cytophaga aurantiaca]
MNWWAKFCSPAVSIICLILIITSCKKEGDFNLGGTPGGGSNVGVQYTDTITLTNQTFLLNDSLISARPANLSFGAYSDPGVTGVTYAEAYSSLTLGSSYVDYTGVTIDSSNLYLYYDYAYGDTLSGQDLAVHQVTTQMDVSVPYQTTTGFVTYDPTIGGSKSGIKAIASQKNTVTIPLANTFASTILGAADDRSNIDFNSNYYGIVVKSNNNSTGSVIRGSFSNTAQTITTRLIVYFKRGSVADSAAFYLVQNTASFNRVITDRSSTPISSLVYNTDNLTDAATNNKCYIQAGTGVVTKVTIPYLKNLATIDGASVIINKAVLIAPIDETSNQQSYWPVRDLGLLELNPDNTYKYRNGVLAYVPGSYPNNLGAYPSVTASGIDITTTSYSFDITRYLQFLLSGKYPNDGFILNPIFNSYYTNRVVLNGTNASTNRMRLEIYYTKVK